MSWKFEFTETFKEKAANLPKKHQKCQVKALVGKIIDLDDPRDIGGLYLGTWAYIFGNKSLIQCDLNDERKTAIFTKCGMTGYSKRSGHVRNVMRERILPLVFRNFSHNHMNYNYFRKNLHKNPHIIFKCAKNSGHYPTQL